jgi:hypothetical protein
MRRGREVNTSFSGVSRVCRVCGQSYPANSPTCPRCGYTPASSAPDAEGGWKQRIPLPARPNVSGIGVAVLITGLVLPLVAGALLFLSFSDGISDEARPVERPGPADPGRGAQSRDGRCERNMTRYLRELSGAFGKANATAALFIEASNEFGPGSARYRALIDIYGDIEVNTLMAKGKPKRALAKARPQIRAACAR